MSGTLTYAHFAFEAGDVDAAADIVRCVLARDPHNVDALFLRGRVHAKREQWALAQRCFTRAALRQPTRLDAWCAVAEVALQVNEYQTAAWALRKAVALDPDMQTAHGTRARMLVVKAQKRLEAAK